ncbi:hypothetical protein C8R44DRAFT_750536 [Mycena epipterygia]|nr:hypothetical protein C8R44DRAFT_750536 [Mycena epipterygia]
MLEKITHFQGLQVTAQRHITIPFQGFPGDFGIKRPGGKGSLWHQNIYEDWALLQKPGRMQFSRDSREDYLCLKPVTLIGNFSRLDHDGLLFNYRITCFLPPQNPRYRQRWYPASHQLDIGRRSKWVHHGPSFPGYQLGSQPGCKLWEKLGFTVPFM